MAVSPIWYNVNYSRKAGHVTIAESNQKGSSTESVVSCIIANYDARKISVIRVGRGSDRVIYY